MALSRSLQRLVDDVSKLKPSPHACVYAERRGRTWSWHFAHPGGSYPLLRTVARYLEVDYHQVIVGFRTIDGYAVEFEDPEKFTEPDFYVFLPMDSDDPTTIWARICAADIEPRLRALAANGKALRRRKSKA